MHLLPTYRPVLQRVKVQTRVVQVWNEKSTLALQGCFDCTDWFALQDSCGSIDELTDVACSYNSFCVDSVIPSKTIVSYPNNKPWISKELKNLLREKKTIFNSGDKIVYAIGRLCGLKL